MNDGLQLFVMAWALSQAGALLMLAVGSRIIGHRHVLRVGEAAHRKKMRALDRTWPLTLIRPAIDRGDVRTCVVILSSLIVLKSVSSLVFGIVMVFWLPIASLLVPAIVAVHDPDDPTLASWVRRVATLQVTSHALAAALGFTVVALGPLRGAGVTEIVAENGVLFLIVSAASLVFAIAAGRLEASGVMTRGL